MTGRGGGRGVQPRGERLQKLFPGCVDWGFGNISILSCGKNNSIYYNGVGIGLNLTHMWRVQTNPASWDSKTKTS